VEGAARAEARAVARLFQDVGHALEARAQGRTQDAAATLRDAAMVLAGEERHYEAAALLEVALRELASVGDAALEADVARRLGKACWRLGRLERGAELYHRAWTLFRQLGDRASEVISLQGLGNVRAAQGRWRAAEAEYRLALERCADDDDLRRGQIYNNLSQGSRRLGALDEARAWQRKAEAVWAVLAIPAERVIAQNNAGLLHLAAGDTEQAREALQAALAIATSDLERAVLLVNLGHVALRSARTEDAKHLARESEEFAILAGAADILIEAYTILGCAGREGGEANCVAFFEKALDLARESRLPLAEARGHLEYGRYRRAVGDDEEATAHFRLALAIFETTDDAPGRADVRTELGL
jgi:tetratricopeptide (TPR) repeat protein